MNSKKNPVFKGQYFSDRRGNYAIDVHATKYNLCVYSISYMMSRKGERKKNI